jgi:hypothetical protein
MGIKVWIMKGEFTERDLSPTCWNGQNKWWVKVEISRRGKLTIKVENQTLVKKVILN